jgi:hypothetical protein
MYAVYVYPDCMDLSRDPLAALGELERRFDGPIPEPLRLAAEFGSAARVEQLHAEGQAAFFRSRAQRQVALIRKRRAEGSLHPAMLADFVFYRAGQRYWRREAWRLRATAG